MKLKTVKIKYDPDYPSFGLVGEPHEHEQHINQRRGLDLYVHVVNLVTGESCHKKLYRNTKGLHFKHTGYSPTYIADMTSEAEFVPHQVLWNPLLTYNDGLDAAIEYISGLSDSMRDIDGIPVMETVCRSLDIAAKHMPDLKVKDSE